MNPVSFGSRYNIYLVSSDLANKNAGHSILEKYCADHKLFTKSTVHPTPIPAKRLGKGEKIYKTTRISAERENDHKIDMICNNYKIKHVKMTDKDIILKNWTGKKTVYDELKGIINSFI